MVIARYVVDTAVTVATFRDLFLHELRWARTYRTARPLGYFFSVVTLALPIAILGGLVGGPMLVIALILLFYQEANVVVPPD